jgi:diadenosine tetraphosphate (Ap4A) HIT family hydrolase
MHPACVFCDIYDSREKEDTHVIVKFADFYILASIGPLTEGHLLIITNDHMTSMSQQSESRLKELERIKNDLCAAVSDAFAKPIFFEHGDTETAEPKPHCCINHAHLHCLPVAAGTEILPEVERDYKNHRKINGLTELRDLQNKSYVYLEENGERYLFETPDLPGQYMRKVISRKLGRPERWDFTVFPDHPTEAKTEKMLRSYLAVHPEAFGRS